MSPLTRTKKTILPTILFCFITLTTAIPIDYSGRLNYVENNAKKLYSKKSQVLAALDQGLLAYYSGDYAKSIHRLTSAEDKINYYFSKSVSQAIGSFIVNDLVMDYAGEDFEDMYLNVFKSLAYYHLGMTDDAIVELNRFNNKSQHIMQKHQAELTQARQAANNADKSDVKVQFHNSPLAQYLALLYHRADGNMDAAYSDANFFHDAFVTQSSLYHFAEPTKLTKDELNIPKGKARINALAFSNGCPYKTQMFFPAIISNAFVAIPFMQSRTPKISHVQVKAKNLQTGKGVKTSLNQIDSIQHVALDTFQMHSAALYSKAIARMIAKQVNADLQNGIGSQMAKSDNSTVAAIGNILQFFSAVSEIEAWLTETADLRCANYFPARADAGGLTVDPGNYDITLEFYRTKGGKLMYRKTFKNVSVQAGKLCLLDATYLGNDVLSGN